MTPIDELERLAKEATPGPWCVQPDGWTIRVKSDDENRRGVKVATTIHCGISVGQQVDNAEYIAACDRDTILALIQRVREAEQKHENDRQLWEARHAALVDELEIVEASRQAAGEAKGGGG